MKIGCICIYTTLCYKTSSIEADIFLSQMIPTHRTEIVPWEEYQQLVCKKKGIMTIFPGESTWYSTQHYFEWLLFLLSVNLIIYWIIK